jgi:hypothetical protein
LFLAMSGPLEGEGEAGPSFIFDQVFAAFGVIADIAEDLVAELDLGVQAKAEALGIELGGARAEIGPVHSRDGSVHIDRKITIQRLGNKA